MPRSKQLEFDEWRVELNSPCGLDASTWKKSQEIETDYSLGTGRMTDSDG